MSGIESTYGALFALGFMAGGVAMIVCLTLPPRPPPPGHDHPERYGPMLTTIIVGIVAGAWLAAVLTSSIVGPLVIGVILGMVAMVRASFDHNA